MKKHCATRGLPWTLLALFLVAGLSLASSATALETELVDYSVVFSATGALIDDGDGDHFSQRHGVPRDLSGGIEELYLEQFVGENGVFKLQGRGIVDNNDYLLDLSLEDSDKGFLRAGYREFRNWYDGSGGFFPQNGGVFLPFFDEDLSVDRGEGWLEGGLTLPGLPDVTLKYRHASRDGQKNATTWGNTDLAGPDVFGNRSIVPAFWDIDEERHIIDVEVAQREDDRVYGAAFRYESSEIDNSRNIRRNPEAPLTADRFLTHRDGADTDMVSARGFFEGRFRDDSLIFTSAYSFTNLDSDVSGTRIYGDSFNAAFMPAFANRQPFDEGFLDLDGWSDLDQHLLNLTLMAVPTDDLRVTVSIRGEREESEGSATHTETSVSGGAGFPTVTTDLMGETTSDATTFMRSLAVRYSGVRNLVAYFNTEWETVNGDLFERETDITAPLLPVETLLRDTDIEGTRQRYTAGATWYPARRVNVAGRLRYGIRDTDYTHNVDVINGVTPNNGGGNRLPAYVTSQETDTYGGDVRVTWRACDNLRLVTRLDHSQSNIDSIVDDGLDEIETADITTNAVGVTASWTPDPSSYLQASANYVDSKTETPATDSLAGPLSAVVTDFSNDYWTASIVAGRALDERTDLEARYFFYSADNYSDNSDVSQPYGAETEEHGITVSLSRRISDSMSATIRYGFVTNDDDLRGGNDDNDVHLLYGGVEFGLE